MAFPYRFASQPLPSVPLLFFVTHYNSISILYLGFHSFSIPYLIFSVLIRFNCSLLQAIPLPYRSHHNCAIPYHITSDSICSQPIHVDSVSPLFHFETTPLSSFPYPCTSVSLTCSLFHIETICISSILFRIDSELSLHCSSTSCLLIAVYSITLLILASPYRFRTSLCASVSLQILTHLFHVSAFLT